MRTWWLSSTFLVVFCGLSPTSVGSVPVQQSESNQHSDFSLTNLCDTFSDDEDKKEKCHTCFMGVSDPDDGPSVLQCVIHLPKKVADCVKKMAAPNGEKKYEKCQLESSESAEGMEKDELDADDDTHDEIKMKMKILQEMWKEFGTSIAMTFLLQLIEETDQAGFQKLFELLKPCKEMAEADASEDTMAEAMQINVKKINSSAPESQACAEAVATSNGTNDEENRKQRRETQETSKEIQTYHFCDDLNPIQMMKFAECALKTLDENEETFNIVRPHILELKTPIPTEIVRIMMKKEKDCEESS